MYNLLKSKFTLCGKSKKDISKNIEMPYQTFINKLSGKTDFTLDEAIAIKTTLSEYAPEPLEILFAK